MNENSTRRRAIEPIGAGRLGVVSGYFRLSGVLGGMATAVLAARLVIPDLPVGTTLSNPLVALGSAALMTFGFFRTSILLDQRLKTGAQLAALCFIGPQVGYATGTVPSLSTLVVSGVGLALVASVWRHLE